MRRVIRMSLVRLTAAAMVLGTASCREAEPATGGESTGAAPRYALGAAPRPRVLDSLDTDVDTAGRGLPPGHGDARQGAVLFRQYCANCHGAKGQGMPPVYPALIGREPREGFPFANDPKITKTIGNYWPYATTLFDYIRRAMPFTAPGSLSADEIYSLTAYLLEANEVLPPPASLDSASLVAVRMPARAHFVPDDRRGGREIR
jgi:cytochrome c